MNMVETHDLSRVYGRTVALANANLSIEEGSVYGFIGPNGAGKTTTMRILATLLAPSAGTAFVGGVNVGQRPAEVRRHIGYMPDFFGVYQDMRAGEYLDFFGACYQVDRQVAMRRRDELLELVDLTPKKDAYVDSLSRGMKQRLGLARTLMHDPALLVLDEPASGLDPRARIETRELMKELRKMGKTILVSSHILADLAEICTHVAIIERGRLLASGPVEALMGQQVVQVRVLEHAGDAAEFLVRQPQVVGVEVSGDALTFRYRGAQPELSAVLKGLVNADIPVVSFFVEENNLESIFLQVTRGVSS